ncbi:uncharacterized protein PRCAT00005588001 [Priceomyces carsonii]|uniref:uncharacterized protein n=1 Tax=Priceomyces carsonii TaxID=28549 RepID=UPI002ED96C06|nr:unnamed protein product [Priceomyces carsonii]
MVVGESRTELLQWLNLTLDLNYTKVEQCGTGAAYCQLMDSIVGGVPMNKVKFEGANSEYEYRQNMKILQAAFTKHNVTKVIDVERLIKCRLQDNLDLLQWFKRFWMDNKGVNDTYDAKARRKMPGSSSGASGSRASSVSSNASRRATMTHNTSTSANIPTRRISSNGRLSMTPLTPQNCNNNNTKVVQLNKELCETTQELNGLNEELQEYKISVESLETERNFYFNKLREIEILTQNIKDLIENGKQNELDNITITEFTSKLQNILYSTEEGFRAANEYERDEDIETF